MSLLQWNIRGFVSNREQVRVLFKEYNLSAMCIQETKLGDHTPNLGFDYSFYRSPPLIGVRAQGGTGIVVRKSVNHRVVHLNSELQASAIQIFTDKWVTICSLYLDPSLENRLQDVQGCPRQLELNDLQSLIDQLPQPFILMGDFNAKHNLWGESCCDRWGLIIEQLLDLNDVTLMNDGSPTRHDVFHNTDSAIDLTICSSSLRLDYQWAVDQNDHGSDHWPIHLKYVKNIPSPCLPKWKVGEADWGLFNKSTEINRGVNDFQSSTAAYEYLVSILICGAMLSIPQTSGKPRRPVVPWWNDACALSRKIARTCYKRYHRYPCLVNKITYKRALAKKKKIFKQARRESFIKYISELKFDSPLSLVWNRIRKLQGKFSPSPLPILRVDDLLLSDAGDVAETFGRHFSNISSALHYSPAFRNIRNNTTVVPPVSSNSESYNLPFTMEELDHAISLSSPTSPGEDEILYSMIFHLPRSTKQFLLDILNSFWFLGMSPKSWKISIIVPVLKPLKDSYLPKNYRPIALTSCVCKIYERMVNARLVWYLESKNLLSNRQFGFRKNRSTIDPLMFLTREIQNAIALQNQTIAVFFDLEKAYDTTWRGGILMQLVEWDIKGNMFSCIKDFLSGRYLKVRVGSCISSAYPQEEGLPQGSVLSPTLFMVAINGLLGQVPVGVHGLVFADDYAVICSKSSAVEACHKIQTAINAATSWASTRGFKFSPEKTKAIRFCRLRRVEEIPTLFLNDSILPFEDSVKYLGITFDRKLTFDLHINEVVCSVKLRLNILKVVSGFNWGADRTCLLRMYQALCLSKIDYGCQVYGSACQTTLQKLDVVHNTALRICTGAYKTSPVESLYVDSGFPPLFIRREELGLRYMSKILSSKLNPNFKFVKEPIDRAPNRPRLPKPFEVRLVDSARTLGLLPPSVVEVCPQKFPPWARPNITICPARGDKKLSSDIQLKANFLEHASGHADSINIYTDGSKFSDGVGCSVVTPDQTIKKKLPKSASVFTAELLAVLSALRFIFFSSSSVNSYTIFTDSMSVLTSLGSLFPYHHLVQEIQDWFCLLQNRRKISVTFCWVPSHVGVVGNELADVAAKTAARLCHISGMGVPLSDFRSFIKFYRRDLWQDHWSNLSNNFKLKSIRPSVLPWSHCRVDRRSSIVLTRLRIGHSYLTHKYLMASGEERRVPLCSTCRVELTIKHVLVQCPFYELKRRDNILSNMTLLEILGENAPVERIVKFLKDVNIFYDI